MFCIALEQRVVSVNWGFDSGK